MRQGFRPKLEPPKHRKALVEARRPWLCLSLTSVVVLLVFAIFGVSAWNVYAHRFDKNTNYYHTKDEVSFSQVNNDLSSIFCDGYNVAIWGPGQSFLLSNVATVNTTYTDTSPVEMHQQPFRVLNVKASYLLTGSIINVTACREKGSVESPAKIVFIKGEDNFLNWRKNNDCGGCVLRQAMIPFYDICDNINQNYQATVVHKMEANDMYFLIVFYGRPQQKHHLEGPGIRLKGLLKRTHFDVSKAEQICNAQICHFDLPWRSEKDVVVKFEGSPWMNNFRNVTTQCQTRIVFWVGLFGILPIVAVIPVSLVFGWFLCRSTKRNAKALRQRQEERLTRARISKSRSKRHSNIIAQNEDYGSVAIQDG